MNNAFTGCSNLTKVTIPRIKEQNEGVDTIEKDVFLNCSKDLTIYGYKGTLAERYAKENGIKFSALDAAAAQKTTTTTAGGKKASTSTTKAKGDSPKTGDRGIGGFAAAGAAAAILALAAYRKRKVQ